MGQRELIPDVDWENDEEYDHACPTCGSLVEHGKKKLHTAWHEAIYAAARSYVEPPRYG